MTKDEAASRQNFTVFMGGVQSTTLQTEVSDVMVIRLVLGGQQRAIILLLSFKMLKTNKSVQWKMSKKKKLQSNGENQ